MKVTSEKFQICFDDEITFGYSRELEKKEIDYIERRFKVKYEDTKVSWNGAERTVRYRFVRVQ